MAFRWRADGGQILNIGLVALWFFRGSGSVLKKKPKGSVPHVPNGSTHADQTFYLNASEEALFLALPMHIDLSLRMEKNNSNKVHFCIENERWRFIWELVPCRLVTHKRYFWKQWSRRTSGWDKTNLQRINTPFGKYNLQFSHQYIQWIILTYQYQTLWKSPLIYKGVNQLGEYWPWFI